MNSPQSQFDFDKIAGRYDRCNHLFSLGIDRLWRKKTVKILKPKPNDRLLDLCCGTGDVVFSFLKHSPVKTATGVDVSEPMIHLAQEKRILCGAKKWMQDRTIRWHVGDAANLAFEEGRFDIVTCAFGIRNIPDPASVLKQIYRVLAPSGRIGILEFSLPKNPLLRGSYLLYLSRIMPVAGRLVLGHSEPLKYLAESIQQWDTLDFAQMLSETGFIDIQQVRLSGGIVTLWVAQKNESL